MHKSESSYVLFCVICRGKVVAECDGDWMVQAFNALNILQLVCQDKIVITKLTAAAYAVFGCNSNENIHHVSALHECTCTHVFKNNVERHFKI